MKKCRFSSKMQKLKQKKSMNKLYNNFLKTGLIYFKIHRGLRVSSNCVFYRKFKSFDQILALHLNRIEQTKEI